MSLSSPSDPDVEVSRPSGPSDWEAIRRICCSTARAGGNPIDPERWRFFGEFWIGPYQKLRPEWAYVLRAQDGRVEGYLTSAPDTLRFERERMLRFRFPLLFRVLRGTYVRNADTKRFLRRAFRLDPEPESRFSEETRRRILRDFPAHLHINLDAEYRGSGRGGLLVQRLLRDLGAQGVAGVHLFCAPGPVKFYQCQGFEILETVEFAPGVPVLSMARASISP